MRPATCRLARKGENLTVKILGREPTLWIALANAVVLLVGTFGLHAFSGQQAALAVVVINALFGIANAWTTRPVSPALFTYAIGAILAFFGSYGFNLPAETVVGLNAAIIPILALLFRGQVSPQETAVTSS